jgi:probable rRNA maturation factor
MPNPLILDVRVAVGDWDACLPPNAEAFAGGVLKATVQETGKAGAVALLLTDDDEMRVLNRTWKSKDAPTNVLSFPAPEGFGSLGDVAMGFETVAREAQAQGKSFADHAAHLLVHGYLHLLGHDHHTDSEAEAMEAHERTILAALGIADPYRCETEEEAAQPR